MNQTETHLTDIQSLAPSVGGSWPPNIFAIIIPIVATIVIAAIFLKLVRASLSKFATDKAISKFVVERAYKTISMVVYVFVAIIILYVITRMHELIYLAIGTILIALAANWDLLANFIAYYILTGAYGLKSGDTIHLIQYRLKGRVTDISPLYTKVLTMLGDIVYIPNRYLVSSPLSKPTYEYTTICLEITATLSSLEPEILETIEKEIRTTLTKKFKSIVHSRGITVSLKETTTSKARYEVCTPIVGAEGREEVTSTLIRQLAQSLLKYEPTIKVKSG